MLVNVCSVVFRWITNQVLLTGLIINLEILLCFSIQEPEISHLHHTGMLSFDSVIDNSNSSGVVDVGCGCPNCQELGGGLWHLGR
jgi:hypothetical protein